MVRLSADEVRAYALLALAKGATVQSETAVAWSVAGSCTNPRPFSLAGKPLRGKEGPQRQEPLWLDMEVRCRRCAACLKARSHHWAERALLEVQSAERTWFGTLTFSPDEQWLMQARARVKSAGGFDEARTSQRWDEGDAEYAARVRGAQFSRLHHANGPLLTKWLKRIRKNSGATLRYILVAEAHKSGMPHYHCLIMQARNGPPILHRHLAKAWVHGFSQFKLAEPGAVRYVCKYLAKSADARIRASLHFGRLAVSSDSAIARQGGRRPVL